MQQCKRVPTSNKEQADSWQQVYTTIAYVACFQKNTTTAVAARRELHTPDAVAAVRRTCGGAERVDADVMRGCTPQRMLAIMLMTTKNAASL